MKVVPRNDDRFVLFKGGAVFLFESLLRNGHHWRGIFHCKLHAVEEYFVSIRKKNRHNL
ncbi:hypothetical protein [Bacillus pseudomycoides]|uniref:hypothetical protein n=1 Tax=Bacillus pseudomycoides TaxID=64104 RepID=UPI0015CF3A12|nr:hypothetical protein [Bacillus pseudomycoides]